MRLRHALTTPLVTQAPQTVDELRTLRLRIRTVEESVHNLRVPNLRHANLVTNRRRSGTSELEVTAG